MRTVKERLFKALHEKNAVQRQIARRLFDTFQRLGFHLTGDHFYDSIPNTRLIDRTYHERARPCAGIDFCVVDSEAFLLSCLCRFSREIVDGTLASAGFVNPNAYFSHLDAIVLYSFLRQTRPKTIVEIGQGMSTRIIASACKRNWEETGDATTLTSIDPYARLELPSTVVGPWIRLDVRAVEVQSSSPVVFRSLRPGDLLFVDSSHVFKFGSDVAFEFEHIYPHIPRGVVLHVHDIFSPFDYPKDWMTKRKRFWNEQYFLEEFLRFNREFQVLLPVHLLARESTSVRTFMDDTFSSVGFRADGHSFYIHRGGITPLADDDVARTSPGTTPITPDSDGRYQ